MDFHLGIHWLSSFSLRNSFYLLVDLVLCPENLALATVRLGPPEYGWKEVWFTPHLQLESYQLSSALGNRLSFSFFWLFLKAFLNLGRVGSFCPLWDPSCVHGVV